jgi:hypothetical protein
MKRRGVVAQGRKKRKREEGNGVTEPRGERGEKMEKKGKDGKERKERVRDEL